MMLLRHAWFLLPMLLMGCLAALLSGNSAAAEEIAFFDSVSFDRSLSDELTQKPDEALVLPSAPFTPNQIPPRLEKWFGVIASAGGAVKLKREVIGRQPKGMIADLVEMAVKAEDDKEQAALYDPVRSYDAILTYDGIQVTSVKFVKRPIAVPADQAKEKQN